MNYTQNGALIAPVSGLYVSITNVIMQTIDSNSANQHACFISDHMILTATAVSPVIISVVDSLFNNIGIPASCTAGGLFGIHNSDATIFSLENTTFQDINGRFLLFFMFYFIPKCKSCWWSNKCDACPYISCY
jgi:hypothetical protein